MALAALLDDGEELGVVNKSQDTGLFSETSTAIKSSIDADSTDELCLLAGEEFKIPSELCMDFELFLDVMKSGFESLSDNDRKILLQTLPADQSDETETIEKLFNGSVFHFGNPLEQFHSSLNLGFYQPDVYRLREVSRKLKYHSHLERQQKHTVSLLCELAKSRQQMLLDARCLPPASLENYRLGKRGEKTSEKKPMAAKVAKSRYARIMFQIRQEAGSMDTSSSGEETDELSHSVDDIFLNGRAGALDEEMVIRNCLKQRKKALKHKSASPSPAKSAQKNESLFEVVERAEMKQQVGPAPKSSAKQQVMNGVHADRLKKPGERRAKLDNLKGECSDMVRVIMTTTPPPPIPPPQLPPQPPPPKPQNQLEQIMMMTGKPSFDPNMVNMVHMQPPSRSHSSISMTATPTMMETVQQPSVSPVQTGPNQTPVPPQLPSTLLEATHMGRIESFFHVLHGLLTSVSDNKMSISNLEGLVKQWLQMARSALANSREENIAWQLQWLNDRQSWPNDITSALRFLGGTFCPQHYYPQNFSPLVDVNEKTSNWMWLEDEVDLTPPFSRYLLHLYQCWMRALSDERTMNHPTASFHPDAVDLPNFHVQEQERFSNPTEPFTYVLNSPMHRELTVGPVRHASLPNRSDSSSSRKSARDHSILIAERPHAVTVLTLVRDAVARLSNGEGQRTDICNILKDSQYLRPNLQNLQLTNAVSGALDRLHSERDPCVRYDNQKKVWIYLHRGRSRDDFIRIGRMLQLAAQKRQSKETATLPLQTNMVIGSSSNTSSKTSAGSSKSRRPSTLATESSQQPQNAPHNIVQRQTSLPTTFPNEHMMQQSHPQQAVPLPPHHQQQMMMQPQMIQQQPPHQLSSPMHPPPGTSAAMFNNGPGMMRPAISSQQLHQLHQTQQMSPRQPMPPQHQAMQQQGMMQPGMTWQQGNGMPMQMVTSSAQQHQHMAVHMQQQSNPQMMMGGPAVRQQQPMHGMGAMQPGQPNNHQHFPHQQHQYHGPMHMHMENQSQQTQQASVPQQQYFLERQQHQQQQQMIMYQQHQQQQHQQQYRVMQQQQQHQPGYMQPPIGQNQPQMMQFQQQPQQPQPHPGM